MNAKTAKEVRSQLADSISKMELGEFEYIGQTKDGSAFSDGVDVIVIKATIKNEGFDLQTALIDSTGSTPKVKVAAKKITLTQVDKLLDLVLGE